MPIYNASIAYAGRGEALVHVTRFLSDVPEEAFSEELYVSVRKKVGSDKEERIQDWTGDPEDFDFAPLPQDRVQQNGRDSGLDLYLPPSLNDPLALDVGTGQFVLRLRFGREGNIYECLMTMQSGQDGELYLIASAASQPQQPEAQSEPEPQLAAPGQVKSPRKLSADERKKLMVYGGAGLILLLLLLLTYLALNSEAEVKPQPVQNPPKVEAQAPQQAAKPEEQAEESAKTQEEPAEKTQSEPAAAEPESKPAEQSEPPTEMPTAAEKSSPISQAGSQTQACVLKGSEQSSDQELLSACIKSGADKDKLYTFAEEALAAGRCDLAKRLLSSSGRSGQVKSSLLLAQLYDPNAQRENSCVKKNTEQAVYWYEKAAAAGEQSISAAALEKLKNAH